eukprot:scaffold2173_cov91-Skeletonema_marinoi.AAC.3
MVDDNDRKGAKRQKLLSEQRSSYEEDMARINAALNEQPTQPASAAADGEEKNENSGDTQQHQQQQQQGGHESDDEEGGNWLKNFTPHHTRVGENFQVTDLPTPSATTSHSTSAAVIVPKQ